MSFTLDLTEEQVALRENAHACDAKLCTIFEGTSEIQRLVIGRASARKPTRSLSGC